MIAFIYENYLRLFMALLKVGYYEASFFEAMKHLFSYDSILHIYSYQIPEDELKRLRSANQEWRRDLSVGDMVDAIIDDQLTRCSGWSQARIDQINGDTLHLEFIHDVKTADRYLDRWSVEIAQFETKTKESFEWKATLKANDQVDAKDNTVWNKSTILEINDVTVAPGRIVKMATIGFRVYCEGGTKSDERGQFEGWSNRFDEKVSIFSPRIQPYLTKTLKGVFDDQELDDNYDQHMEPAEGQTRVYAVPRVRKCTSSLFMRLINLFGNEGGYDLLLDCLRKDDADVPEGQTPMDINILGILVSNIS